MIDETRACKMCGTINDLEVHHCIHGTATRKRADEDGLTVYLCHRDHERLHRDRMVDLAFIQFAQRHYELTIGSREDFIARYGKSWL